MNRDNLRKVKYIILKDGKDEIINAYFHGFFQYADEDMAEANAVIEFEDGKIDRVPVFAIQFLT
ncbi:MAG: hypothetical protein ABF289_18075 [Clostridiales bacterium]